MIDKVVISNFKQFQYFVLDVNDDINILVGDNEAGKSTILEAIYLGLTGRLNGKHVTSELTPYLFNTKTTADYIEKIKKHENVEPPELYIELYLKDSEEFSRLKGTNNSLKENVPGIKVEISFNQDFADEYEELIKNNAEELNSVPSEYYRFRWLGFHDQEITYRSIDAVASFIDASVIRLQSGSDYYMQSLISSDLDPKQRAKLALEYRNLKEDFSTKESIVELNKVLSAKKGDISDKELSVSIDITSKTAWELHLSPHLDGLPFGYIGKGEQNILKIMLALERTMETSQIILIEEPENHLSFSTMHKLIKKIKERCYGKQVFLCTHSAYVLNKLGLDKLTLINNGNTLKLDQLPEDTGKYFMKLSGYDTLRLILAKKTYLVEGPSDELILQKAYKNKHGRLPIDDGIDVISVNGLAFKRFLDIAYQLEKEVAVITDNDGKHESVKAKYANYTDKDCINVYYSKDNSLKTLEDHILNDNGKDVINNILGIHKDEDELLKHMKKNKTDVALELFTTEESFTIPGYINDSV